MKTAMEQALARIELLYEMKPDAIHWEMFKNDCMEKEKEQIIDAAKSCNYIGGATNIEAEQYYNETFKK